MHRVSLNVEACSSCGSKRGGAEGWKSGWKKVEGVNEKIANPLNLMAGDLGLEPRTFGSGDQRSILLS